MFMKLIPIHIDDLLFRFEGRQTMCFLMALIFLAAGLSFCQAEAPQSQVPFTNVIDYTPNPATLPELGSIKRVRCHQPGQAALDLATTRA